MYLPRLFEERDSARIRALIEAYPFATLAVVRGDGSLELAHLPFLFDREIGEHGRLRAHVAAANPVARLVSSGARATVVFRGPDAYVSPSWYEKPKEQVPTWNYAAIHVHGRLVGPASESELLDTLAALVDEHERLPRPWQIADLTPELRAQLVRQIVGFSLLIDSIEAKFKLSQNRSPADQQRVRTALAASSDAAARAVAELMGDG